MASEAEIEAAAKALCFSNQQAECAQCTPETCLYGLRDYRVEATAALEAAERVRSMPSPRDDFGPENDPFANRT